MARLGTTVTETRKELVEIHRKSQEEWAITQKRMAESTEEMERVLTEKISVMSDNISKLTDNVNKWVGRFGNRIGEIVEMILIPGIKPEINKYGHNFKDFSARKYFARENGKVYAEVDLFLEDGDEALAVEVKTHLRKDDVEYQLRRLKLLRDNETDSSLRGKTLYSAVAGLEIDDDARETALSLGMYVVEMVEETEHVTVIKPSVELGKW
jgi:RNA binding exosome subunit